MKVTIRTSTVDCDYEIQDLPDADCLELVEEFAEGDAQVLTLQMDDAVVKVARRHIVAIELDQ